MSLTHLKTATVAHPMVTKVTVDPATQPDMRRSPAPNPSIMSVLSPKNESEIPTSPVRYNTPVPHPLEHIARDEYHNKAYAPSTTDSMTSRAPNSRMSWGTSFSLPVTFSGWLLRHNATHFTFTTPWKRYYYVLSEHALQEYKSDKPDSPLREQFDFSKDTLVFLNEGFPGKPFVVEIRKPGRRMCLQCTDLDTMKQWMNHLKKSIAQVRRDEYLKIVEEETQTKSQTKSPPPHQSTADITVVHNSSNINEDSKGNTKPVNPTPIDRSEARTTTSSVRYRSKSDQSSISSLSHLPNKSLAIPPQLPPPSHSPPPIPNV
jgi:PH domain